MHHSHIDRFAQGDSPVHHLDARAKLIAVLAYTVVLISFDRYAVLALAPMCVMPLGMMWLGGVPVWFALRRVVFLSPFIAMACILSPLYDHSPHAAAFGPWHFTVTGGWLTAADVAVKFTLGVMALTALTSTTPFSSLLQGMRKLAVPKLLVAMLGLVYRYIFVLIDQAMRVRRARDYRGGSRGPLRRKLAAAGSAVGSMFVRTLERADRVHLAMQGRGYRGEIRGLAAPRFVPADAAMLALVAGYLVLCRWAYPRMLH